MTSMDQLEQDLRYVRSAVARSDAGPSPRLIWFLWAVFGGAGFALVDIRPAWVMPYWMIAGPSGFVLSALIGWRHALGLGQGSAAGAARPLLHWGALMGALALAVLLPARGLVSPAAMGPMVLLLVALVYFLAGVHMDRAFLWIGLVLAAGYVLVLTTAAWAWVTLGVLFALALVATGLRAGSRAPA